MVRLVRDVPHKRALPDTAEGKGYSQIGADERRKVVLEWIEGRSAGARGPARFVDPWDVRQP
jgi:hypothetical protein